MQQYGIFVVWWWRIHFLFVNFKEIKRWKLAFQIKIYLIFLLIFLLASSKLQSFRYSWFNNFYESTQIIHMRDMFLNSCSCRKAKREKNTAISHTLTMCTRGSGKIRRLQPFSPQLPLTRLWFKLLFLLFMSSGNECKKYYYYDSHSRDR